MKGVSWAKIVTGAYSKRRFFGASAVIALFAIPFLTAFADENIEVRGRVGSVITGPSSEDTSDDDSKKEKAEVFFGAEPIVFIEPTDLNGAAFSGIPGIPQFTTSRPAFRGTTNIQNADITLIFSLGTLSLRSASQANAEGVWNWISPEDFPNGNFQVTALAFHPTEPSIQAKTSLKFSVLTSQIINPWSEQILESVHAGPFDLTVKIQDQYKRVAPGQNIVASIRLVNTRPTGDSVDVAVEYIMQDEAGVEILRKKETVAEDTKLSYLKVFYTQPDLKEGIYKLIVKIPSQNTLASASAEFAVQGKSELAITPLAKIDYTTVLKGVGVTLVTFTLLSYFEFIRFLRIRKYVHTVTSKFFKIFF